MFTGSRQESSQLKARDEIPFRQGDKKKYFFTGLGGLYLTMQLTD